jgi:beta-lactam-binding protein with PASTA domain
MKKKLFVVLLGALFAVSTLNVPSAIAAPAALPAAGKCVVVKNVVGKNYQKAQDIWRAQGFWVKPALDATGQGRSPWIDSGWFVTAQSPKAGTCVKKGSNVRATVKKYTD